MYILTVAPIEKGIFKEELSYFSKANLAAGSLVLVPVRGRNIPALVLAAESASVNKTKIKASNFSLKKVTRVIQRDFFRPEFLAAARLATDHFAVNFGQAIKFATPKAVLTALMEENWPTAKTTLRFGDENISATVIDKLILQDTAAERLSFYRSLIRETFARDQSIFITVPTALDAEKLFPLLGKGIEQYTVILHSKTRTTDIIASWKKALTDDHPLLIIATPLFLSFPKRNIGTMIIEQEGSDDYRPPARPFIDGRRFAEFLAETGRRKLIIGDSVLRPETIYRHERRELAAAAAVKYRLKPEVTITTIDMKKEGRAVENKTFTVIGRDLEHRLRRTSDKKQLSFLLVGRRGLAPTTICNDCESLLVCPTCGRPLVLHSENSRTRIYACHHCDHTEKSSDHCPHCGSWRLSPLGIGTETVASALNDLNLSSAVFILDSDHAETPNQAAKIIKSFMSTPGGILLGTEMALRYLDAPVATSGIVSVDHLFARPGFRTTEHLLRLFLEVRELTQEELIIQTRVADEVVFSYIANGNLLEFYRDALAEREAAGYPPFARLLRVTRTGTLSGVERDLEKLSLLLKEYEPLVYPAYGPASREKYTAHLLLKLKPNRWPEEELVAVLRALPPAFIVEVEPADII